MAAALVWTPAKLRANLDVNQAAKLLDLLLNSQASRLRS